MFGTNSDNAIATRGDIDLFYQTYQSFDVKETISYIKENKIDDLDQRKIINQK